MNKDSPASDVPSPPPEAPRIPTSIPIPPIVPPPSNPPQNDDWHFDITQKTQDPTRQNGPMPGFRK